MAVIDAPYLSPVQSAVVEGTPDENEPIGDMGLQPSDDPPVEAPAVLDLGPWLTWDKGRVAKVIDREWTKQAPGMKARLDTWRLCERRRAGDMYSKMVADSDTDQLKIYIPPGIEYAPPTFSRTDELCEKMVAQFLADPPVAQCEPAKDDEKAKDAAEFSTRFLEDQSAESALNATELIDKAEDEACATGSGFIWVYGDPQGGGPMHKKRQGSMAATGLHDAVETQDEFGQTVPQPEPYQDRYVTPAGMFTEDSEQADIEFKPKICAKVGNGRNVRFLPETEDIKTATGVLWAEHVTLGSLKIRFPELKTWPDEDLRALVSYTPEQTKMLLPKWARTNKEQSDPQSTGPSDDEYVLTITGVQTGNPEHPKGAYVVMAGGKFVLYRGPWTRKVTDPVTGEQHEAHNSIWLAQFRQFFGNKNPYGQGVIEKILDGDPILALAIGSILDRITKANNPHKFVPIGSGISEKSFQLPRGTPIPYNAAVGVPIFEQLGDFPPEVTQLLEITDNRMQTRIGLSDTAQGLESPSSGTSGIAKTRVIQQAQIALSRVKRGFDTGYIRFMRILLEAGQMLFTAPQMLSVVGPDGAYKYEEFTGADIGTTVDVRIKPGSGTLLAPDMKEEIVMGRLQVGAISPEQAQDYLRSNLRAQTGLQDDPILLRVNRQIARWEDGPPADWQGPPPPPAPVLVPDPMTGQPVPQQQPAPPDPMNPYADALPIDDEPLAAKVRHWELRKLLAGTIYAQQPPPWQQYALAEYDRARRAAGIVTLQEQAQAQQAQVQQQQQAEQQSQQSDAEQKSQAQIQGKVLDAVLPDPNTPENLPPGVARTSA